MAEDGGDSAQALPIDIAYNKLADWLVDRTKVPADFRKKLATVRARVSAALPTLPRGVDPGFRDLTPDSTGYLEAKHVRDVLLAKLPESRSLFGRPTGAAGEWDAIVSAYEKDLIFLGEAAQIMVQSTNYDIPYHKKQIAKLQQQLSDSERKESELKRNAVQSAARYQEACQELGIPGVSIRAELRALGNALPKIFAGVIEGLCSGTVGSALEYYRAFCAYAHGEPEDEPGHVLPTLTELLVHPPDVHADLNPMASISEALVDQRTDMQSVSQIDSNTTEIDWGVETGNVDSSMPVDIDWDVSTLDDLDAQDISTPEIVLQDLESETSNKVMESHEFIEGGPVQDTKVMPEISWDVEMPTEIDWNVDVQDGSPSALELSNTDDPKTELECIDFENVSRGDTFSTSWFANSDNRNSLLDDLFELKVFVCQRQLEIQDEATAYLQSQVQVVAPSSVPQHGSDSLRAMLSSVSQAIDLITNRKTSDLILIATSIRYRDRLEASLMQKKETEWKLQKNIEDLNSKRLELRSSQALLWPKQEALIGRTQSFKQLVENILSAQYNGRRVNIVGEINTLLGQVQTILN